MTNVLILCTGNSARSILGEALIEREGGGRFHGFSAGSLPKGEVHPLAIELLKSRGIDTARFASKSWDAYAAEDAPEMDIILTVCDNAAGETCPVWPGHPVTAHWGIPDPAAVDGDYATRQAAFDLAWQRLETRVRQLVALPVDAMDKPSLREALERIGQDIAQVETGA